MRLALASAAVLLLAGCSDSSCDELPGLVQERDGLRAAYAQVAAEQGDGEEVDAAHDRMHAVEERVFDLEQACG